jgi:hypothetical protein
MDGCLRLRPELTGVRVGDVYERPQTSRAEFSIHEMSELVPPLPTVANED